MKSMAPKTILLLALLGFAGAAHALQSGDVYAIDDAAQHSLEYTRTDESTGWINPDTGSEGTFTPVATHEGQDGQVCREYSIDAIIGGRPEQVYGIACRQPDGSWVESNSQPYQSEPPAPVDVAYPQTTYVSPWWGLVSSFALSGSYCSDGFCFGGRYGYSYPYGSYYPYGYGYYPYSFRFNYSYYDYGKHHRSGHHYRSHRSHSNNHYRHKGYDRHDRRSGDRTRSRGSHDSRSGDRMRSRGSHDSRSRSAQFRGSRSHDTRSTGSRSRGNRSGKSRVARASRNH